MAKRLEVYLTELDEGYSLVFYTYGLRETKFMRENKGFRYNWLKTYLNIQYAINLPKLDDYEWTKNAKGQRVGYWCNVK